MIEEVQQIEPAADPAPVVDEAPKETLEDILTRKYDEIQAREPSRDDGGRFASKTPGAAPAATPVQNTDQPKPTEGEPAIKPAIAAPDSWSAEHKAKFASLPPDVQAYIAQREGEAHKAITQKGEELKRFEPLNSIIAPHRARLAQAGIGEHEYVNRLLDADAKLANPATREDALRWVAQAYGIDLARLAGNPAGAVPAQVGDPALAAALQKIDHLTRWAQSREQAEQRSIQERQAAADREAEAKAQAFLSDPKFPHAKELEGEIAALIMASRQLGQTLNLEDAYARATRANPAVWAKLEAERIAAEKKDADEKAAKAAAEAKRRAPTTVKPRGASAARAPLASGDWEARMRDVYDRIEGTA